MTQKISFAEIHQRVTSAGWELLTTQEQWQNLDCKSSIRVRSAQGFEQDRPAAVFSPNALPPSCQFSRTIRKGETITVLVAAKLLDVYVLREYTPPCLKLPNYRLDGFAEFDHPLGGHIRLALEHQGDHRVNSKAPLHAYKGGADASMAYWENADACKSKLLQDDNMVLVKVPDVLEATSTIRGAVNLIATALEEKLPFLLKDTAYLERKNSLSTGEIPLGLPASWDDDAGARVQAALKSSGDDTTLTFVRSDVMTRKVTLRCKFHGELEPTYINNVLGSVDAKRAGTRCPICAIERRADAKRTPFAQVTSAAVAAGFLPRFDDADYRNNQQVLPWQCLKNSDHMVHVTFGHLLERGCPGCRGKALSNDRQHAEFTQIERIIRDRGDTLLSTQEDYVKQNSTIRFVCKNCGEETSQSAGKIKIGQAHGCQRIAFGQIERSKNLFERFKAECSQHGITILTTVENYFGYRKPVEYTVGDDSQVKTAPPYRLTKSLKTLPLKGQLQQKPAAR
jgi:hypothetical protein